MPTARPTSARTFHSIDAALIALVCAGHAARAEQPPSRGVMAKSSDWKRVDKLVGEQKLEAASAEVAKIREAARASGNEEELTRALIKEVQLRIALHGYETAVRFL